MNSAFEFTGTEQIFIAPITADYTITAIGAGGAKGNVYTVDYGSIPGKGAKMTCEFPLIEGDVLHIVVGGKGTGSTGTAKDGASGGSGGGTFIFKEIEAITDSRYQFTKSGKYYEVLLVASGGGGTWDESYKGSRGDGYDGNGVDFKHPSNHTAWGITSNAGTSSSSISACLGITQYINYNLIGAFYTRNSSTGQGGYGGGSATDDNYSYGGGWSSASYVTYSWASIETAIGESGVNEEDGTATIEYEVPIQPPSKIAITDRTNEDVRTETLKGFYNFTDLNRVEKMTRYIADLLTSYGYPVTITSKTDWGITDFPTASEMKRYFNNVKYCVSQYNSMPGVTLPISMERLDYIGANNIEKMLVGIEELVVEMIKHFRQCGTFNCGEGYND